jgi:hypothetical protein
MHVAVDTEGEPDVVRPRGKSVRQWLAIVQAINAGELLAALPESPYDRQRHQTAVTLLESLEEQLQEALRLSAVS